MATTSVPQAILDKIASLNPVNFAGGVVPVVYFGNAPEADTTGQISIPYFVLSDEGQAFDLQSDFGGTKGGTFTLELYDFKLGDLGTSMTALRYNGQAPENRAGLDFATLDMAAPFYHVSIVPLDEIYSFDGYYREGRRVHKVAATYRVVVGLGAALAP